MALTVGELQERLAELDPRGEVYVYCGPEGVRVKVEYHNVDRGSVLIVSCPTAIPLAGGAAQSDND